MKTMHRSSLAELGAYLGTTSIPPFAPRFHRSTCQAFVRFILAFEADFCQKKWVVFLTRCGMIIECKPLMPS